MNERRRQQDPQAPTRRSSDLAWAAAMVEGEGHVGANQGGSGPILVVTNTDSRMLDRIQRIFRCGSVCAHNSPSRQRSGRRPAFTWVASGDSARRVLRLIYPYLVAKRDQADVAMQLTKGVQGRCLTDEERARRKRLIQELRRLTREAHPAPYSLPHKFDPET